MEQEVDSWIAQLSQCKQLSEADVKRLCDKVPFEHNILITPPPGRVKALLFARSDPDDGTSDTS
jgi:hypothetical protein